MKNICLKFLQIYQNNLQPLVARLPVSLLTVLSIFTAPQSKKGKNAYFFFLYAMAFFKKSFF